MALELAHSLVPKRRNKALAKPNETTQKPTIGLTNNEFGDNNYLHIGNVVSLG